MGGDDMRYFLASPEIFNALRDAIMAQYGMPNNFADEPWPADTDLLALAEREYTPPDFAALIDTALTMGAQEITAAQYQEIMRFKTTEPPAEEP